MKTIASIALGAARAGESAPVRVVRGPRFNRDVRSGCVAKRSTPAGRTADQLCARRETRARYLEGGRGGQMTRTIP
jgi:hypothetical protein